jgi:hypothetical protein
MAIAILNGVLPGFVTCLIVLYAAKVIKSGIQGAQRWPIVWGSLLLVGIMFSEFFTATGGGWWADYLTYSTVSGAMLGAIIASIWFLRALKGRHRFIAIPMGLLFPLLLLATYSLRDAIPKEAVVHCDLRFVGRTLEAYHATHGQYPLRIDNTLDKELPPHFNRLPLWSELYNQSPTTTPPLATCYNAYDKSWLYQTNTVNYYTSDMMYSPPPAYPEGWLYSRTDDTYTLGYIYPVFFWVHRVCRFVPATKDAICDFRIGDGT